MLRRTGTELLAGVGDQIGVVHAFIKTTQQTPDMMR
jgi:phage-related protein